MVEKFFFLLSSINLRTALLKYSKHKNINKQGKFGNFFFCWGAHNIKHI